MPFETYHALLVYYKFLETFLDLARKFFTQYVFTEIIIDLVKNKHGYWLRVKQGEVPKKRYFTFVLLKDMCQNIEEI